MPDPFTRLRSALADRYTIEGKLGEGGMATVYLAEDLKHHRKVALKVLEPELAATVGAERFLREIELAARLQHPNILPVHDSGEAGGFVFYVMPYVEGESLRDRLERGALPIPDAVRILVEVADALSHAHAHGVVHRDIKPDNVLLSGRHALVVDFGVAKAVRGPAGVGVRTGTGVALGTPAYMAPEQAIAGAEQDHRVDIYALGVLGYELLAGRGPFTATTTEELLAAHVTAVPEPVETYRPEVSPGLSQVVMRCLAKRPGDRWQTAEEVRAQLEPLATPSGGSAATGARPLIALGGWSRLAPWTAGAVAVAGVALAAVLLRKPRPLTITLSDITQVTSEKGVEIQPAISPDGREVAYIHDPGALSKPRLIIRGTTNVAGGGEVRVTDTSYYLEMFPKWNPDGEFLRFGSCRAAGCGWYQMGRMGGAVRPMPLPPRFARVITWSWSPDGSRIAFVALDTIYTISMPDTSPRRVMIHTANFETLHSLAWSPEGHWIAYVNGSADAQLTGSVGGSSIWIVDAAGGEPRQVTPSDASGNASPAWLDERHLLFVSNRDGLPGVYVIEVGKEGARGEPRAVAGVADPQMLSYSIATRKLAWSKLATSMNLRSYPLDPARPVPLRDGRPVTTGNREIMSCDVSPDGRWIAFESARGGTDNIYKMPLAGGDAVALTHARWSEYAPRWSPDGTEIVYMASVAGPGSSVIWTVPAVGGTPIALTSSRENHSFPSWSPDGLKIGVGTWVASSRSATASLLSRDSVGGAWKGPSQLSEWPCLGWGEWAPDGSGVACKPRGGRTILVSPQTGRILRNDLAATSRLKSVGSLRFSRDGTTLYARGQHQDGRDGIWAIPLAGGPASQIVAYGDSALSVGPEFCLSSDRLLIPVSEPESDVWVATLHW